VVVVAIRQPASIWIALDTDRGLLVDWHRVGLTVQEQGAERPVDIHAGDHDPSLDLRQCLQRNLCVRSAECAAIDQGVRPECGQLIAMRRELRTVAVQMLDVRQVVRLELAAVHDHQLVAGGGELLDGGAADEPRAAEDDYFQRATGATTCGFFSTMRSIWPHSFACSGVMKKSRSIALSTSSSCRLQCLA